jgi:hypothetical protein
MSILKSVLRWLFGVVAATAALLVFNVLRGTFHAGTDRGSGFTFFLLAVAIPAGVVCGMAWWTNRRRTMGSPASRVWGVVASTMMLLLALLPYVAALFFPTYGLQGWSGDGMAILCCVAGVIVFAWPSKSKPAAVMPRKPMKGDRTRRITDKIFMGLAVITQIAAMRYWAYYAHAHGISRRGEVPYLVLVAVAAIAAAFVHECGHAVMAWIFNMKLLAFQVGPFRWAKRQDKWGFRFTPAALLRGGGAVNVVPTDPRQPVHHDVFVLLAGPLATLWIGAGLVAILLNPGMVEHDAWRLVVLTGTFCIIGAMHNLLPFRLEEGAYSDGARILQIATRSGIVHVHRALKSVQLTLVTGMRPREWEMTTFQYAAELHPDDMTGLHLRVCSALHHRDCGNTAEAIEWLNAAEAIYDQHQTDFTAEYHTTFVFHSAYLKRDAAATRTWWERMEAKAGKQKDGQKISVDYWLAKTCLEWMEGRLDEAKVSLGQADEIAKTLPLAGAYECDRDRCKELRKIVDAAIRERDKPVPPPPMPMRVGEEDAGGTSYSEEVEEAAYEPVFHWPGAGRLATR